MSRPQTLARPLAVQARQWLGAAFLFWLVLVPSALGLAGYAAEQATLRDQLAREIMEAERAERQEAKRRAQIYPLWQQRVAAPIEAAPDQLRLRGVLQNLAQQFGLRNLTLEFYPSTPPFTLMQLNAEAVLDRQVYAFLRALRTAQQDRLTTKTWSLERAGLIGTNSTAGQGFIRLQLEMQAVSLPQASQ